MPPRQRGTGVSSLPGQSYCSHHASSTSRGVSCSSSTSKITCADSTLSWRPRWFRWSKPEDNSQKMLLPWIHTTMSSVKWQCLSRASRTTKSYKINYIYRDFQPLLSNSCAIEHAYSPKPVTDPSKTTDLDFCAVHYTTDTAGVLPCGITQPCPPTGPQLHCSEGVINQEHEQDIHLVVRLEEHEVEPVRALCSTQETCQTCLLC